MKIGKYTEVIFNILFPDELSAYTGFGQLFS